jgi:hypothetical protein
VVFFWFKSIFEYETNILKFSFKEHIRIGFIANTLALFL